MDIESLIRDIDTRNIAPALANTDGAVQPASVIRQSETFAHIIRDIQRGRTVQDDSAKTSPSALLLQKDVYNYVDLPCRLHTRTQTTTKRSSAAHVAIEPIAFDSFAQSPPIALSRHSHLILANRLISDGNTLSSTVTSLVAYKHSDSAQSVITLNTGETSNLSADFLFAVNNRLTLQTGTTVEEGVLTFRGKAVTALAADTTLTVGAQSQLSAPNLYSVTIDTHKPHSLPLSLAMSIEGSFLQSSARVSHSLQSIPPFNALYVALRQTIDFADPHLSFYAPSASQIRPDTLMERSRQQAQSQVNATSIIPCIPGTYSAEVGLTADIDANTHVSVGVGVATNGVFVSVALTSRIISISIPLYVSENVTPDTFAVTCLFLPITAMFFYRLAIRPFYDRYAAAVKRVEDERFESAQQDNVQRATVYNKSMNEFAQQTDEKERRTGGLVIVDAQYGYARADTIHCQEPSSSSSSSTSFVTNLFLPSSATRSSHHSLPPMMISSIDVRIPLQFFIRNSALTLTDRSKSKMMGFHSVRLADGYTPVSSTSPSSSDKTVRLGLYIAYISGQRITDDTDIHNATIRHVFIDDLQPAILPDNKHNIRHS